MGYKTEKLYEDTYLIRDDADEALYLIERNHKAYLIDTGMDHDSLKAKIEKMTDLPITVLLTHGHIDHIGRTGEFNDVFMDLKDLEIYKKHMHMNEGNFHSDGLCFKDPAEIKPIKDTYDDLQIIPLQGHTPGSIIIVDPQNKAVYTGDAIGSGCGVWMQIAHALTIAEYKEGLETAVKKLEELGVDNSWKFHGGHYGQENYSQVQRPNPLTLQLIKDMIELCDRLLHHEEQEFTKVNFISDGIPYYTSWKTAEMILTKERI